MAAHLKINGENCIVVHADGTEEDFRAFVVRVTSSLPAALQGSMDQFKASDNGNLRIGFGAAYFPRNDSSKTKEENQRYRSLQTSRKWVVAGAIITELVNLGVDPNHFSASSSYRDGSGNWQNTCQIWLNNSTTRSTTTTSEVTVKDLIVAIMDHFDDITEAAGVVQGLKTQFGDDPDMYGAVLLGTLKKLNKAQAGAEVKAKLAEVPDVVTDDEMPES
jgi:hypothetical protein